MLVRFRVKDGGVYEDWIAEVNSMRVGRCRCVINSNSGKAIYANVSGEMTGLIFTVSNLTDTFCMKASKEAALRRIDEAMCKNGVLDISFYDTFRIATEEQINKDNTRKHGEELMEFLNSSK